MNICRLSTDDLVELDMVVKRKLREEKMHGRQASDERLYLPRSKGRKEIKSMRDLYKETKVRVACYMAMSKSRLLEVALLREHGNEYCSVKREEEDEEDEEKKRMQCETLWRKLTSHAERSSSMGSSYRGLEIKD